MSELHNRGGARIGSGRPKTEETKMMRIPLSLVSAVEFCFKPLYQKLYAF
jgi:hypothetical protein